MTPDTRSFAPHEYAEQAARVIADALRQAALRTPAEQPVSLALAGGSTPRVVYRALASLDDVPWPRISIWFGDERAVPPDHPDSNYAMATRELLAHVAVRPDNVHRMSADSADPERAARDYEAALPSQLDVLLLGIGEDGHTASLFPGSAAARERERRVVVTEDAVHAHRRLTITPPAIAAARRGFVLATGSAKADPVARALGEHTDPVRTPARYARAATWLLDTEAAAKLRP